MKGEMYMLVLGDSTEVKPVYDSDLQELSRELLKFVETYTTNINVDDINVANTLEKIKDIGNRLKNREYYLFFDDLNIISFDEKPTDIPFDLDDPGYPF